MVCAIISEEFPSPWIQNIYTNDKSDPKLTAIMNLFSGIHDLANKNQFDLNDLLSRVDIKQLSILAMIAWIRYTSSFQDKLPYWIHLLTNIRDELESRGENSKQLLHGLNKFLAK